MKKVLVVDDSKTALASAEGWLQQAGYCVSLRQEPLGTGAAVLRERPDIVVLDVGMPSLSGEKIVGILREEVPEDRMPVVLLYSSMQADNLKQLAERCGADGFATKDGGAEALLAAIDRALQSKSATK